jgi:hypothetical protein
VKTNLLSPPSETTGPDVCPSGGAGPALSPLVDDGHHTFHLIVPPAERLWRISYCWRQRGKLFGARTIWRGRDRQACFEDFRRRNPHVISFTVLEEVL